MSHTEPTAVLAVAPERRCTFPGCRAFFDAALLAANQPDEHGGLPTGWRWDPAEHEDPDLWAHDHRLPKTAAAVAYADRSRVRVTS